MGTIYATLLRVRILVAVSGCLAVLRILTSWRTIVYIIVANVYMLKRNKFTLNCYHFIFFLLLYVGLNLNARGIAQDIGVLISFCSRL